MHVTPRSLASASLLAFVLAPGCQCGVPDTDDAGEDAIPCIVNSDCGEDAHCADGFCVDGLAPGTCRGDEDCEGEEICLFPEGSDVGACVNPHACDDDGDCLEGQVCEDGNDDGFRDCLYAGCESDDECAAELAGQCGINDAPRCVARACVCRDLCGAPCGDDRQCCALDGTTATCIDDPGPCGTFTCDPGFGGQASSFGDWEAPLCGYADEVCSCVELPPLPPGAIGNAQVLREAPDGSRWVIAYDATYGDVVVAPATSGTVSGFVHVAGVPPVSVDAPIVAGPSGPRGGIEAPGNDVGRALDAAFAADGTLYIVAYDATAGALVLVVGTPGGTMSESVIDATGDVGHAARVHVTSDGDVVVAAVARRTAGGLSELRVYGAAHPVASGSAFFDHTVDSVSLATVDCEGGCAEGEVCAAAVLPATIATCEPEGVSCDCPDGQVCTVGGCRADGDEAALALALVVDDLAVASTAQGPVVVAHDARAGALTGYRVTGGDVAAGTATFTEVTITDDGEADVGGRPSAVGSGGSIHIASTDATGRALVLTTVSSTTLAVQATAVLDDGQRPDPSGAINDHAVDAATLSVAAGGDVLVAWQDGTAGAVYARVGAPGALGPRQILAGGLAEPSYVGTFGLALSSTYGASGPAVSARHLWLAADPPVQGVVVTDTFLGCPADDPYEDNDDATSATVVTSPSATRGVICGVDDDDHYVVDVGAECTIIAELFFENDDGDLDVRLFDAAGASLDTSLSVSDSEIVTATPATATTVRVVVEGFQDAENAYVLHVDVDCT